MAVTLSGTTGTLYVDGQPVATNTNMTLTPADLGDTNQNWIGRSQFIADPYLAATVDDFQIYDHALSAAEIAALASGQPGAGNVADVQVRRGLRRNRAGLVGQRPQRARSSAPGTSAHRCGSRCPTARSPSRPARPTCPSRAHRASAVGQKMTIGYGRTLETATVTAVGTPGTQD